MKIKEVPGKAVDLDDFLERCLKPPESASKACSQSAGPSVFYAGSVDWCDSPKQPGAVPDSKGVPNTFQKDDLDWCFAPAPPSKGVVCRSLSGFDFDSFFDECSNPSNQEKASSSGKVERKECPASEQSSAFENHQQVPMPAQSEHMTPHSSVEGFTGMKFDSDAFFNDFLGSTGSHSCANTLKTSSVVW